LSIKEQIIAALRGEIVRESIAQARGEKYKRATYAAIARRYGVSKQAVWNHAKKEGLTK
jgi:hypothetical protein